MEVFFSNPDLLWSNDFATPRYGQGAFACALQALHKATTGNALPKVTFFGKPNPQPYRSGASATAIWRDDLSTLCNAVYGGQPH